MSENKILRIGITLGDLNGIGTEVIIKTLLDGRMSELCTPVVYGSAKAIAHYKRTIEGGDTFTMNVITSAREAKTRKNNLIDLTSDQQQIEPGHASAESSKAAAAFLERAVADLKEGLIDAVVTGPINKESMNESGWNFTGHTEYFADRFSAKPMMIMCSQLMKVGLVTIHLPLSQVSAALNTDDIATKIARLRTTLISDFAIVEPRIAVLALNPHSGEGGMLGHEESEIIAPAIRAAVDKSALAFGPFAADGFFSSGNYAKYDAVLAMYHDQGLAPFKALTSDGVNYSASLPIIRTSPDHGVAYDIAGDGKADESSLRAAIYTAIDAHRNRHRYNEMTRNPLRRYERERGADISVQDLKLPEASED